MPRLRSSLLRLSALVASSTFALLLAAPVVAGDPCYHGFEMPPRTVSTDPQVKVAPCAFAPTVTRIPVGGTVTFFNGDGPSHLITGANQEWGSRDVELGPNATVAYTFDKAGTYPYACALHRGMSGTIVVGDPDTALAVTDEAGNVAAGGVAGGDADDRASDSGSGANGVALAVGGGALGVLVGVATMAYVARRRPARPQPVVTTN